MQLGYSFTDIGLAIGAVLAGVPEANYIINSIQNHPVSASWSLLASLASVAFCGGLGLYLDTKLGINSDNIRTAYSSR
jgi:hypothetical protein